MEEFNTPILFKCSTNSFISFFTVLLILVQHGFTYTKYYAIIQMVNIARAEYEESTRYVNRACFLFSFWNRF